MEHPRQRDVDRVARPRRSPAAGRRAAWRAARRSSRSASSGQVSRSSSSSTSDPDVLEAPFHLALRLDEPRSHAISCPEARRTARSIFGYAPQRHRLPASAARISSRRRPGCRSEERARRDHLPRRAEAALEGVLRDEGVLQGSRRRRASPSIVVTGRPSAAPTGIRQETTGTPSSRTAHAPQAPSPQPSFAPVRARSSRSTVEEPAGRRDVEHVCLAVDLERDRHPASSTRPRRAHVDYPRSMRLAAVALVGLVLVAAGCGGGGDSSTTAGGCEDVDAPAPRADGGGSAPTEQLDASKTWTLDIRHVVRDVRRHARSRLRSQHRLVARLPRPRWATSTTPSSTGSCRAS